MSHRPTYEELYASFRWNIPARYNIAHDVCDRHASDPDKVALISDGGAGEVVRITFREVQLKANQLANVLIALGLMKGDRVMLLLGQHPWAAIGHVACWKAGLVSSPASTLFASEAIAYRLNMATTRVVITDLDNLPTVEQARLNAPCLEHVFVVDGRGAEAASLEEVVAKASDQFTNVDTAADDPAFLNFTSGTTGNPKGALYSNRSIVLNALSACLPGLISLSPRDTILPAVPMFHVNGWCVPYAAPIGGARMVLPGHRMDAASLYELLEGEQVTVTAGVPTIWIALMRHIEQGKLPLTSLKRILVGGSAMPESLIARFDQEFGIEVRQAWGMTETVAIATMSCLNSLQNEMPAAARHAAMAKQGKSVFGVELKVVDEGGSTIPRDGTSQGQVMVRGQWTVSGYYKAEEPVLIDGWLPTGDIATIDAQGTLQIRDRAKDLIKTGGEWISSIDLEGVAMAHPAVAMAAVVGVRHPKWEERPLLFIVRKPDSSVEGDEILVFLAERLAKWWIPDAVIFLDALPVGGTGKVQKAALREQYGNHFC